MGRIRKARGQSNGNVFAVRLGKADRMMVDSLIRDVNVCRPGRKSITPCELIRGLIRHSHECSLIVAPDVAANFDALVKPKE